MAKISQNYLSTGTIQTGGPIPGIRIGSIRDTTGGANLGRAAQVRAPGRIGVGGGLRPSPLKTPLDQIGPVIDSDSVFKMAEVAQESAFRIAERDATLRAKELSIEVNDKLRNFLFNEDGYFRTEGKATMDARVATQAGIERIVEDGLASATHDVRAKAYNSIQSYRNTYLTQVAKYGESQWNVWDRNVDQLETENFKQTIPEINNNYEMLMASINAQVAKQNPSNPDGTIDPSAALKRIALKDEYLKTSIELLIESDGVTAAERRFMDTRNQLTPDTALALENKLRIASDRYLAKVRQEEADNNLLRSETTNKNNLTVFNDPKSVSQDQMDEWVRLGTVSPSALKYYNNDKLGVNNPPDPELFTSLYQIIYESNSEHEIELAMTRGASLPPNDFKVLQNLRNNVWAQGKQTEQKSHYEQLVIWSTPETRLSGVLSQAVEPDYDHLTRITGRYEYLKSTDLSPAEALHEIRKDPANRFSPNEAYEKTAKHTPLIGGDGQYYRPTGFNDAITMFNLSEQRPDGDTVKQYNRDAMEVWRGVFTRYGVEKGDKGWIAFVDRREKAEADAEALNQREAAGRPTVTPTAPTAAPTAPTAPTDPTLERGLLGQIRKLLQTVPANEMGGPGIPTVAAPALPPPQGGNL